MTAPPPKKPSNPDFVERMYLVRDPAAIRLAFAAIAFDERQSAEVRAFALKTALGLTDDALEAACAELVRVGVGHWEWLQ